MTYEEYISYHNQGDAGVEERMIASLCRHFALTQWDAFRLIYYYTMTYHIPSALDMLLHNERDVMRLQFRTDRRWVGIVPMRFARLLSELQYEKLANLQRATTTQQAYDISSRWYYFGRYTAFLFLEVYCNVFKPKWEDNIVLGWEPEENYTKGAILVTGSNNRDVLDDFLYKAKKDTGDNSFAIETSLCAVEKINKGTRWNGYYTERMLNEAQGTKYETLIYKLV